MFRRGQEVEIIGSGNPITHFIPIGNKVTIVNELKIDGAGKEYYTVKSKSPYYVESYFMQRISPSDLKSGSYDTNNQALHLLHRKEHV